MSSYVKFICVYAYMLVTTNSEVDWWSLGIVCFELVTGWPPFFDKEFEKMCDKILKKTIRFSSKYTITMEAQQLILGFLERNPQARLGASHCGGLSTLQEHIFYLGMAY